MSLTARNAQVYKGTAAVTYGSGSGVSNRELQGTASVTYGGAPTSNTALSLPGPTGNYMNINPTAANFDLASNNMFVECWFYSSGAGGGGAGNLQQVAAGGGPTINVDQVWGLYFYFTPNNSINFYLCNNAGGSTTASLSVTLNYSTWYHAAISWVASTKSMYVFLNGVPSTMATLSGTVKPYSSTYGLYIGADYNRNTCNGYVRDLRVVQGGTVPTTSFTPAQAPFRLNVPSYITGGSTVLSLAEQYFTPSWLNLPGTAGAYMNLGATHPTNFDTSVSNLFCEAWIYLNSFQTVATSIIGRHNTIASPSEDWMLWINGSKQPQFRVTSTTNASQDGSLASVMNTGQWYHLAGSWDNTNKKIYVFLNGTASAATNFSGTARFNSTWAVQLGIYTGGQYLNGYIQDTRVVRGGIVPTASFTPAAAPFGLASPSYVASMGTTVLSLATQYYQTTANGLLPQVFLGPDATYPTYTTTSSPTFNTSNVSFIGNGYNAGNFINFGQTTINMSLGYSIVFKFAWTGSYQPAYERIFDFGVAGGNSNAIIVYRNGTSSTLNFGNFVGGTAQTVTSTSTFPQNTDSGTVICIYDPSSTGSLKMYVNGSLQATLTSITIIPNGSFPSSLIAKTNATGLDAFANVNIYSMKFYNRVLSSDEIAKTASSIPYIQMYSRPVLPAVLVNPGTQSFTLGQSLTISQTALEPANGITWTLAPTGQGVSIASSTDYALTLSTPTAVTQNLFTVSATNKAGLTTVTQFTGSTPSLSKVTVAPVAVYSLRGQKSTYTLAFNVRNGTTNASQNFYADTLGNLTTAAGSGQTLTQWLGGATGYITTWYDQSGNGNHASQGTTAYQPVITSALIASNLFGLNFQNSCGLTTSAFTNSLNVTLVMVIVIKSTIATWGNFAHHGHHDYDWSIRQNGLSPTYIHWHTNNDNTGDQLAIIYDTPMVLYCTMTNGTAMSFQMLTSTSSYVTTATESLTLTVGSKIMYIGKSDTSEPCNSYIGEFNYFQSVLSATDQTAILADVCSRWGITNFNPLFNTTSSTVTSAVLSAYSLRDLYGTSPVVVNVRRSSDNSTQNFYADTRGNLTTLSAGAGQTLASWLGGATGYVTTWYDQSGLGNHASQATSGNQPVIQSGTKGPGYMLSFTATQNQYLTGFAYSKLANTKYTVCEVDRRTASISPVTNGSDNAIISCGTTGVTDQCLHLTYRSGTTAYYGQFGDDYSVPVTAFTSASTEPVRFRFHMASSTSGSGRRIYVYGDPLGYVTNFITGNTALLSASGVGNFYIGYYFNGPTYYQGELYETIVFNNSLYDLDNTAKQIATIYDSQYDYINTPK